MQLKLAKAAQCAVSVIFFMETPAHDTAAGGVTVLASDSERIDN